MYLMWFRLDKYLVKRGGEDKEEVEANKLQCNAAFYLSEGGESILSWREIETMTLAN